MRHRQSGKHFNRSPAHREALFRNLSRSLITHERIVTTLAKAKALRPYIEKLITMAKKAAVIVAAAPEGDKVARAKALHLRRQAMAVLGPTHGTAVVDKKDEVVEGDTILKKLFRDIGPRYKERPGGYTRIVKQHYRRLGDGGHTAVIELLKEGEKKVQLNARKPAAPAPAPAAPAAPTA
ncbi:MAG TPA: 50S ribosomal protein L17 [Urbifossiella sp.]|nr:50S ribosomal protein L17 [Urbifossiella sp.]